MCHANINEWHYQYLTYENQYCFFFNSIEVSIGQLLFLKNGIKPKGILENEVQYFKQ